MILEITQLLNNALIIHSKTYTPIYKPTHIHHPASLWTKTCRSNFEWLNILGLELCKEYTYRYERTHKCQSILENFASGSDKSSIPAGELTPFVKCMPDQYKVEDVVQSYRNYYQGAKSHIAVWTKRGKPYWWKE